MSLCLSLSRVLVQIIITRIVSFTNKLPPGLTLVVSLASVFSKLCRDTLVSCDHVLTFMLLVTHTLGFRKRGGQDPPAETLQSSMGCAGTGQEALKRVLNPPERPC